MQKYINLQKKRKSLRINLNWALLRFPFRFVCFNIHLAVYICRDFIKIHAYNTFSTYVYINVYVCICKYKMCTKCECHWQINVHHTPRLTCSYLHAPTHDVLVNHSHTCLQMYVLHTNVNVIAVHAVVVLQNFNKISCELFVYL